MTKPIRPLGGSPILRRLEPALDSPLVPAVWRGEHRLHEADDGRSPVTPGSAVEIEQPPEQPEEVRGIEIRVPHPWEELGARAHYENVIAADFAERGYTHFAEIIEAGHACAACHLTHGLNGAPTNAQLDLTRYSSVATTARALRKAVEVCASTSMLASMRFSNPIEHGHFERIGLARRVAAYRSSGSGVPFDPAKLKRIQRSLERQGVSFVTGDDGRRLARALGGEAVYIPEVGRPGIIAWGSSPSRTAVVEELLHLGQHRRGGWADVSALIPRLEVEAQEKLLRLGARRGWLRSELAQIENALSRWKEEL